MPRCGARSTMSGVNRSARLLRWHAEHSRDLPWRHTRDPWSVLVSELMCQQTQVARVVPKYLAFIDRFPTPAACAAAPAGEVVTMWAGLGYNRRAINLHRSAVLIADEHQGRLPEDLDELLALPGIGPYTARAVLAFAFEHDVGVVDTNAARVLARWSGQVLTRRDVQTLADEAVPPGAGWSWNQAMLDLGATVCTARAPRCAECPVRDTCVWGIAGNTGKDPARGTAGTSGQQSRFHGSDRQGRGRIVDALRTGPISADPSVVASAAGWPDDVPRATTVLAGLVDDGLVVIDQGVARLP